MTQGSARDEAWYDDLCKRYDRVIASYVARQLEPWQRDIVSDVVQNVRLVAWRRREKVPDEPTAWLIAAAALCLKSMLRKEANYRRELPAGATPETIAPSHEQEIIDRAGWLALVGMLDPVDRGILELKYYFDLSYKEIVQVLAPLHPRIRLTENNAAKRHQRAVEQVRRHVGQDPQRFILGGDNS